MSKKNVSEAKDGGNPDHYYDDRPFHTRLRDILNHDDDLGTTSEIFNLAWALFPEEESRGEVIGDINTRLVAKIDDGDDRLLAAFYSLAVELVKIRCAVDEEHRRAA